jgi:hypothetical protein
MTWEAMERAVPRSADEQLLDFLTSWIVGRFHCSPEPATKPAEVATVHGRGDGRTPSLPVLLDTE